MAKWVVQIDDPAGVPELIRAPSMSPPPAAPAR